MPAFPTPSTSHIPSAAFETLGIYEPAEDSFLFIDTLSSPAQMTWLEQRFKWGVTPLVLEVGTGSGVIIAFLTANASAIFGRSTPGEGSTDADVLFMAIDVNANAAREATKTVQMAVRETKGQHAIDATSTINNNETTPLSCSPPQAPGLFTNILLSDLTTPLKPHSIDVLIFNPPYVPTESLPSHPSSNFHTQSNFEKESQLLALTYAGGHDGMEITNRLLGRLNGVLSDRGVAYILLCARNRPQSVVERLRGEGWEVSVVGESGGKGGWERLFVVRICRIGENTTTI